MDMKELEEKHPELYAKVIAKGQTTGKTEGIAAEVERVKAVNAALIPGHEELVAKLAADGKTTGGEAAQAVLAAENKLRQAALAAIKADAPTAPPAAEAGEEAILAKKDQENVSGLVAGMNKV